MKTGNRGVESHCQPRRLLVRTFLSSIALAALPVLMVIYDGTCLGPARASNCHMRGWASGRPSKVEPAGIRSKIFDQRELVSNKDDDRLQLRTQLNQWKINAGIDRMHVFPSVFQDLLKINLLKPGDKALCIGIAGGQREVLALMESGVSDAIGLDLAEGTGGPPEYHFPNNTFDFEYSNVYDLAISPSLFVQELERTLKPGGVAVLHLFFQQEGPTITRKPYSYSVMDLLKQSSVVHTRQLDTLNVEIGFRKHILQDSVSDKLRKWHCVVTSEKSSHMSDAEPLIAQEPGKPWISLKENMKTILYLSTATDLSKYSRHIYIDIGARNYGSSIGSWFKNRYPKQGQIFEIYAIEADKSFQSGYANHSDVHFLPYAAWIRNESLTFGTNRYERGGMGRIQGSIEEVATPNLPAARQEENHIRVQGFDIADWMRKILLPDDYVVVKMDVEGAEFKLLPHLFDTGAICLIDEFFLECHYNRWQRCCPERTSKFSRTYKECFDMFKSLRHNGVLVHQWW